MNGNEGTAILVASQEQHSSINSSYLGIKNHDPTFLSFAVIEFVPFILLSLIFGFGFFTSKRIFNLVQVMQGEIILYYPEANIFTEYGDRGYEFAVVHWYLGAGLFDYIPAGSIFRLLSAYLSYILLIHFLTTFARSIQSSTMHQFDGLRLRRWLSSFRVSPQEFDERVEENYQLLCTAFSDCSQSPGSSSEFSSPEWRRDQIKQELRQAANILAADEFGCLNYAQALSLTFDKNLKIAVQDFRKNRVVPDIDTMRHLALLSLVVKAVVGDVDYFEGMFK